MTELSRQSEALISAARPDEDPTEQDRARIRRSLMLQLGAAAVATTIVSASNAATATASSASGAATVVGGGGALMKLAIGVGLLAFVGSAGTLIMRPSRSKAAERAILMHVPAAIQSTPLRAPASDSMGTPHAPDSVGTPDTPDSVATAHTPVAPPPTVDVSPEATLAPPSVNEPAKPGGPAHAAGSSSSSAADARSATSRGGDSLGAELRLLQQAQEELRTGHADRALVLLDGHARAFGGGALSEERRAARVLALCKLGRIAEARAAAERFLRDSPESPMRERVRNACRAGQ